jgi:hypothetical protein
MSPFDGENSGRNQSGARVWLSALMREAKMIQAPPPISIAGASVLSPCKTEVVVVMDTHKHADRLQFYRRVASVAAMIEANPTGFLEPEGTID